MATTYLDQATFGPWTNLASASTADLGSVTANAVNITGTTTITSFGAGVSLLRFVKFASALTLTHNATSLILPTGANITTAAGDTCVALSDGSGNWTVVNYQRASGAALVSTDSRIPGSTTATAIPKFSDTVGTLAGTNWQVDASGHLKAATDNTYDIGASAANRPRNVYLGGTLNVGSTATAGELVCVGAGASGSVYVSSTANTNVTFIFRHSTDSTGKSGGSSIGYVGRISSQYGIFDSGASMILGFSTANMVQFMGTTSSFPALKRSSTSLQVRLADDSADAPISASYVKTGSFTVATLPSASTAGAGARALVTDANATTFLSTVAGGGSNKVPVVSDGTNWIIG